MTKYILKRHKTDIGIQYTVQKRDKQGNIGRAKQFDRMQLAIDWVYSDIGLRSIPNYLVIYP